MGLDINSLAAAVGSSAMNEQFQPSANTVPRKLLAIGTYDASKTSITDEVPAQILSAEQAGADYGFGSMLHRLAVQSFVGGRGIPVFIQPQAEAGGAVAADGVIAWSASGAKAETVHMYIAGLYVPFSIADADSADDISTKCVAAIEANESLPASAAVDGVAASESDLTSKSKGPWGNDITIRFNLKLGQSFPTGVSVLVTDMASGAGIPVIQNALNGLGTGDNSNEDFYTDVVHGYGLDSATLDTISTYVGAGNTATGLYDKLVHRPFRSLNGDIVPEEAGLTALIAITDTRLLDRANGIIAVPGSANHPAEIATQAMGHMARINNNRAQDHYIGVVLEGIDPGVTSDRWTSDYDNRDIAVKAGISPTVIENGAVVMQNVVSFYRPANVPADSNGYRSMRNISIIQNMLDVVFKNFSQEKWKGISIVNDVANVTDFNDRLKARDTGNVIDDLVIIAKLYEKKAWIYTSTFTINRLKIAGAVSVRPGGIGFNSTLSVILSGEGAILDTETVFDTSLAILAA